MANPPKPPVPKPPASGSQYTEPIELDGIREEPAHGATDAFADSFGAAIGDLDNLDLVDLEGSAAGMSLDPNPEPPPASTVALSAPPPETATLELALDRDPTSGRAVPAGSATSGPSAPVPSGDGELQLDFGAAGISAIKGQAVAGSGPGPVPLPPSEPDAGQLPAGLTETPAPAGDGRTGLFGHDRIMGFLIAAAIGLLLGIFPALEASKRFLDEESAPAIAELEESVDRPLAVRAGELRASAEIAGDLERSYAATRSRFWTVWLGVAIPIALVLGFVRRKV